MSFVIDSVKINERFQFNIGTVWWITGPFPKQWHLRRDRGKNNRRTPVTDIWEYRSYVTTIMGELIKEIETKVKLLGLTEAKTEVILQGGNVEVIERHLDALRRLSKEVDALKIQVEQAKISNGDALEDVIAWSSEVEVKLASVDEGVVFGGKRLTDIKREASYASKAIEEAALNQQRKEQLEFERAQLELKLEYDRKTSDVNKDKKSNSKGHKAKLPKLTITKFNGTYKAWLSFWNKFSAEVDSTNLAPVTQFAYLKELVDPEVRAEINGLHFSSEGYERVNNILKSEYGKELEIINTYIS